MHLAVTQLEFMVEEDTDPNYLVSPREFRETAKADARKLLGIALGLMFVAVATLSRSLS